MDKKRIRLVKAVGRRFSRWVQLVANALFLSLSAVKVLPADQSSICRSISVIIPTLNEAPNIVRCIQSVSGNRHVSEIIVVDGGSSDQTRLFAKQAGAYVILHDKPINSGGGRGGQINAGLQAACGDVVAILHADAVVRKGVFGRIITALNRDAAIIGGSAGCRFDSDKFRFRLLELANDFRAAFLKISFGDQMQFFRRKPMVEYQLFPAIPLMEDVELSIRLNRLGKQTFLFGGALVSTRRWKQAGFHNSLWVIGHVCEYLIRRMWSSPDTAAIYQSYYSNKRVSGP